MIKPTFKIKSQHTNSAVVVSTTLLTNFAQQTIPNIEEHPKMSVMGNLIKT